MANTPNVPSSQHSNRTEQAGAGAGRRAGDTFDKGRDAAVAAADKLQDKAEGVIQKVQDAAENVGQNVKHAASSIAHQAEEAYGATTATINEFNQDVMNLIHRHPKEAVLIGFGVGCLVGTLLSGGILFGSRRA